MLVIAGAVLIALVFRTYVAQTFFIPSESMEPTLERDDRVVVNKLTYGFDDISRGDVIVFERPEGQTEEEIADLIKRVVGLPGDTLVIDDGRLLVDGEPLDEPYLDEGTTTSPGSGTPLPGGDGTAHRCVVDDPCEVPEGHVFVMGDNRSNSKDSRFSDLGYISSDQVVGKAFVRIWPLGRWGGL